jgi:hypothetical protein
MSADRISLVDYVLSLVSEIRPLLDRLEPDAAQKHYRAAA